MTSSYRHHSQPNQKRSGVFISYARSDGSEFAHRLRQQLEQQNIKLWLDRVGMEGGRDWWLQITEAVDNVSFLLLVVTPNALKSDIVRKEWRYARQQGVCVYPIKGSPDIDYDSMPRWMRDAAFYDLGTLADGNLSPEWPKFLNDLNKTPDVRRVPFMVEDLPANFVHRSREFDQLIALLLDRTREEPVAITAALRGAGGYGKTTIAKSLCHNEEIQDAFDDGILWVTLGETPGDLTGRVEDLIQTISGERPGFSNLEAAITRFTELLADRDILLVIDDVWNRDHLRPFLQGGRRCARLITTRNLDTLPPQAHPVKVDAMQSDEAVQTLLAGLNQRADGENVHSTSFSPNDSIAAPFPPKGGTTNDDLRKLAERLGEWPLLLGLVGGALQDRVVNTNQPLPEAIDYVNRALDKRGLTFFDARNPEARNQAVASTLGVSLELLSATERARYDELAVFPEDVNIPLATLEKYWGSTGAADGFDAEFDTEALCARLNRLSLLHTFDAKARHIRLHDVFRQYLMHEQRDRLTGIHNQLLDAHHPSPAWHAMPEDEPYLWDYLALHLTEAGRGDELVATVKDWRYLAKKTLLKKSLSVEQDLINTEKIAPADNLLRTLRRNYVNTGHLFNHCQTHREITATLFVRLLLLEGLEAILQDMAQSLETPYIVPFHCLPDLPHPALIRTLEGHSEIVACCALSLDGKQIVSASHDCTLKIWDTDTGKLRHTLEGHSGAVNGCAFSHDGRLIASASEDGTLKIWGADTGQLQRTLEGHSRGVNNCALSSDGKLIVSASWDQTLKIWDTDTGRLRHTLEGHSSGVNSCTFSPDGKLVASASDDRTLKIWDSESGLLQNTVEGHSASVLSCAFSFDGKQIVSASGDSTLKIWDTDTGNLRHSLEGHSGGVWGCVFNPSGKQLVSASTDCTLIVWDADAGLLHHTLEGHSSDVRNCAFSPDGMQIISASFDRTLKIWDANTDQPKQTNEWHSKEVRSCAFTPNGKQVVSASFDRTLKIWDTDTGQLRHTLKGHLARVWSCVVSPDGKQIASTSGDSTLKVWDTGTGRLRYTLEGHSFVVNGCAFSPDGKQIVSASYDRTLKVWAAESGEILRTLDGHSDMVSGCAFSPDGKQIVSASYDRTLKVWDVESGKMLRTLKGHKDVVTGCAYSPDETQMVSASSDNTLKIWDAESGEMLRTLEGHYAWVTGCAYSPDGKQIISAAADSTLKVWDAITGECQAIFYADGPLYACAMHGEMIVAGGARGVYFLRLVQ